MQIFVYIYMNLNKFEISLKVLLKNIYNKEFIMIQIAIIVNKLTYPKS